MNSIRLEEPGHLVFSSVDAPEALGLEDALVQVHRIGVCGTDIHAFNGKQPFFSYPRVLGHELGVEVLEVGSKVTNVTVGDRCAVEPYLNCGTCIACRNGKSNCCIDLKVLGVHTDGGMCEYLALPSHKLHPSKTLSLDQLALVETLGIGAHAVARAEVKDGEFTLVIGAGPIGLAAMQFAIEAGAQVIAMDTNESRLEFCRSQLQVPHTINAAKQDVFETLKQITAGDLPTVVFDATGNATSMMNAFEYCAHGGKLVFIGLFQGDVTFHDPGFHRRELTLMSSRNSLPRDFSRIIQLIENKRIDTTPWITHRGMFQEVVQKFPEWVKPENGVLKAMIEI